MNHEQKVATYQEIADRLFQYRCEWQLNFERKYDAFVDGPTPEWYYPHIGSFLSELSHAGLSIPTSKGRITNDFILKLFAIVY